jgi:hypothetical protein
MRTLDGVPPVTKAHLVNFHDPATARGGRKRSGPENRWGSLPAAFCIAARMLRVPAAMGLPFTGTPCPSRLMTPVSLLRCCGREPKDISS